MDPTYPVHTQELWMAFALDLGRSPAVRRNRWYETAQVQAYCRVSQHHLDGRFRTTFDLANVEVESSIRHTGVVKAMVAALKLQADLLDVEYLYAENVLTPQLVSGLERMGFKIVPDPAAEIGLPSPPSM